MRRQLSPALLVAAWLAFGAAGAGAAEAPMEADAADVEARIDACEAGAAVPLDPGARAAPVQFTELVPPDLDFGPLERLMADCAAALASDGGNDRFRLMAIRTAAAHYGTALDPMVPALRELAAGGSAEAGYLLYALYSSPGADGDTPHHGISRDEAIAALAAAAAAGHQAAIEASFGELRKGPLLRRDPKAAIEAARRLAALPRQGPVAGRSEAEARELGRNTLAYRIVMTAGLDPAAYSEGFALAGEHFAVDPEGYAVALATAYRFGRGTPQDAEKAREMLEGELAAGRWFGAALLADMLASGEGGPVDGKRALDLLRDKRAAFALDAPAILAGLLLDNRFVGPDPNRAVRLLVASRDIDDGIRAVPLLVDHQTRIESPEAYLDQMTKAADAGEPGAGIALAKLRLDGPPPFRDVAEGRRRLMALSAAGDTEAAYRLAATQYANLDGGSAPPFRRDDGGPSDEAIRALVDKGVEARRAEAFLLAARLLRRGIVYPQDDRTATNALINAANLGSVEAMVLLGDAYEAGVGTPKDPHERLRAWREAALRGSLAARERIARAFIFDSFDKLISLREGVSERIALYSDENEADSSRVLFGASASMAFSGLFSGGRAADAGPAALADAVLDGFRLAPAGLADDRLVPTLKAIPPEIRLAMEARLEHDDFLKRKANGDFAPDAREALRAFVEAKGPLPAESETGNPPADPGPLDPALVEAERNAAFAAAQRVKTRSDRSAVIRRIDALARYGDAAARWALLRNYHQADFVRDSVSAAEISRYGLDILTSRPPGMDKPDFEFVFVVTQIQADGQIDAFGEAVLAAVRDDRRLRDPLTLGGVLQTLLFAPGACEAVLRAAAAAGVAGMGAEGCDDASKIALIAYARANGPAGVESAARAEATAEIAASAAAEGGTAGGSAP